MKEMLVSKFPNDKLVLADTLIVNKSCSYTNLKNKDCLIYGASHGDPSMYVEFVRDLISIKCKHPDCFGKVYPCEHIQLSQKEMNIVFQGNVQININNCSGCNDDELVEFKKLNLFEDNELNELIYNGMNGKSTPYAEILYYFYKNDFMYGEDDNWYIFENHKWKSLSKKNTRLRSKIHEKLSEIYQKVKEYYISIDEKQSKKVKTIQQIINNFDDTVLKNNIMIELGEIYLEKNNKNRDFLKKLNNNNYLIGFSNGVYDLQNFTFRDGLPGDYVTMSTGYDYKDKYSANYDKMTEFLSDIQPNKEELDYILTYISTGLFGNMLELFTVLTGTGRNGKSKFIDLIKLTFGEYYGSIKSQVLTSQIKDGDAPSPGILDLINKKIVIASETLEGTKLNTGFIKFLTGRDTATYRLCHQNNMIEFSAKFLIFLTCNNIPECDAMDNAFSKRLRCINFPTEFVDGEPTKKHEKKKNEMINMFFDDWKQDFFILLLNHYKAYAQTKKINSNSQYFRMD